MGVLLFARGSNCVKSTLFLLLPLDVGGNLGSCDDPVVTLLGTSSMLDLLASMDKLDLVGVDCDDGVGFKYEKVSATALFVAASIVSFPYFTSSTLLVMEAKLVGKSAAFVSSSATLFVHSTVVVSSTFAFVTGSIIAAFCCRWIDCRICSSSAAAIVKDAVASSKSLGIFISSLVSDETPVVTSGTIPSSLAVRQLDLARRRTNGEAFASAELLADEIAGVDSSCQVVDIVICGRPTSPPNKIGAGKI